MAKPGTQSGAIEHKHRRTALAFCLSKDSREMAQLLTQEAMVKRDFGEEGVKRFWEELERKIDSEQKGLP